MLLGDRFTNCSSEYGYSLSPFYVLSPRDTHIYKTRMFFYLFKKMIFSGLLRDVTGGYSWCFYGMGSCMVLGSIPVIAFHLSTKNEDSDSSVD